MGYPGLTFHGDPAPRTGQVSLVIIPFSSGRLLVTRGRKWVRQPPSTPIPQVPQGLLNLRISRSPLYQEPPPDTRAIQGMNWEGLRHREAQRERHREGGAERLTRLPESRHKTGQAGGAAIT